MHILTTQADACLERIPMSFSTQVDCTKHVYSRTSITGHSE